MATRYASGSDDDMSRGGSPIPRDLFSDEEGSDDGGGRGRRSDEAEEDNSLNHLEGGGGGSGRVAGTQDRNTDDEEEEEQRRQKQKKKDEEKKKKPKGPVRRQMISEDMLIGKNGLSTLPDLFKDFTFGGKGRERQDLDKILSKFEHWIHLLHPKQPFDQCLQRIEFLGGKRKVVKTHLKKIRMNMLSSFPENDEIIEDEEDQGMNGIDATELAENASAFVNQEEEDNIPEDFGQTPVILTMPASAIVGGNADEFPDDDDDFDFETIDEGTLLANSTTKAVAVEEMEIDMEDVPQISEDDDEDNFIEKQIEAQIKRAAEADTQQGQQSQVLEETVQVSLSEPEKLVSQLSSASPQKDNVELEEPLDTASNSGEVNECEKTNGESENKTSEQEETVLVSSINGTENVEDKADEMEEDNDDGIDLNDLEDNDD